MNVVSAQNEESRSIEIYASYDDYRDGKGITYDDWTGWKGYNNAKLKVELDNKKMKMKCNEFWGFTFKERLFRITESGRFVMLENEGKLCAYVNGPANARMLVFNQDFSSFRATSTYLYLSNDLDSPIASVDNNVAGVTMIGNYDGYYSLKNEHPELHEFFACLETRVEPAMLTVTRMNCVSEHLTD
ncbi:MAG: hypothetical protein AB8B53_01195 [Flavobacteriales bacterium]